MLTLLNEAGRIVLPYALSGLIQAAALAVLIGLIDVTLGRRLRASLRHALWSLVVVKLLLPPTLELPTSAAYWVGRWSLEPTQLWVVTGLPEGRAAHWQLDPAPRLGLPPSYGISNSFEPINLLFLLWIAGTGALAAVIVLRQRGITRLLRSSSDPTPAILEALEAAAREVNLVRLPTLRLTSENHSPAVCGGFRPTILLPRSLVEASEPSVLRGVLLHELVHLRRRDLWLNALQVLAQVIWWWNLGVAAPARETTARPGMLRVDVVGTNAFLLGTRTVDLEQLKIEFQLEATRNPNLSVEIRSPRDSTFGSIAAAIEAAKQSGITRLSIQTKPGGAALAPQEALSQNVLTETEPLQTRRFRVDPETFLKNLEVESGNPIDRTDKLGIQTRIKAFLADRGVRFPMMEPSTDPTVPFTPSLEQKAMFFDDRTRLLFVRSTESELQRVEVIVSSLNRAPQQILLETQIVELSSETARQLNPTSSPTGTTR